VGGGGGGGGGGDMFLRATPPPPPPTPDTRTTVTLLFLESVGTTELLLILVVALIIFGPRKLPELSRSLGKGLGEFKRASDEFKRTWEREVSLETNERERRVGEAMLPPVEQHDEANTLAASTGAGDDSYNNAIARDAGRPTQPAETLAPGADAVEPAPQSPHKADWL
jgi:TatA/E family protein of Tat protein translocase